MQPKKLNLKQMWDLYLLVEASLENRDDGFSILDEVHNIIKNCSPGTLLASISIMYDNIPIDISGTFAVTLMVKGLVKNSFFEFVETIRMLK